MWTCKILLTKPFRVLFVKIICAVAMFCGLWLSLLPKILVSHNRKKACWLPWGNNTFDAFAIKSYKEDSTVVVNSKIYIRQGSKDVCCFHIHSLPKITLGSRKHGNCAQSDSRNVFDPKEYTTSGPFDRARKKCIQSPILANVTYPCLIFDWWDWGLIFIKWDSGDKITQNWKRRNHSLSEICSVAKNILARRCWELKMKTYIWLL